MPARFPSIRVASFGVIEQVSKSCDDRAFHFRLSPPLDSFILSESEAALLRDCLTELLESDIYGLSICCRQA